MPPKEARGTCQALGSTAMPANGTLANCLLSLTEAPKWQYMRQNNTTVRVLIGKLRSHTQRDAGHHKTKKGFQKKKKKVAIWHRHPVCLFLSMAQCWVDREETRTPRLFDMETRQPCIQCPALSGGYPRAWLLSHLPTGAAMTTRTTSEIQTLTDQSCSSPNQHQGEQKNRKGLGRPWTSRANWRSSDA